MKTQKLGSFIFMKAAKTQVFLKIHKPTLLAIHQRKNACSSLKKSLYKLFNVTNNVYGMFKAWLQTFQLHTKRSYKFAQLQKLF